MTDYFALLDQARQPWLDPEKLKQAFHERTLQAHPDAHAGSSEAGSAFAQINEAYQVLLDPRRRLHHLLSLEGKTPVPGAAPIPGDVEEFFALVATVTHEAGRAEHRAASATTALSRSIVRPELLRAQARINEVLATLRRLQNEADAELRGMSEASQPAEDARIAALENHYVRFSFLTRWIDQLAEKQARISSLL